MQTLRRGTRARGRGSPVRALLRSSLLCRQRPGPEVRGAPLLVSLKETPVRTASMDASGFSENQHWVTAASGSRRRRPGHGQRQHPPHLHHLLTCPEPVQQETPSAQVPGRASAPKACTYHAWCPCPTPSPLSCRPGPASPARFIHQQACAPAPGRRSSQAPRPRGSK